MNPERSRHAGSTPTDPGHGLPATLALLACLCIGACGAPRKSSTLPVAQTTSRVDLFLRAVAQHPTEVEFELEAVRLRDSDGALVDLQLQRTQVSSTQGGQRLHLAGSPAPPATYTALLLVVRGARIKAPGGTAPLSLGSLSGDEPIQGPTPEARSVEYVIPLGLYLRARDAASLFLDWNVTESIVQGTFQPVLAVTEEKPQVALGKLYVTDAGTDSVLVLDRSSGEIVATRKVGAEPRALAISSDLRRAFVVNARDGTLNVIDLRRNQTIATIPIRLGAGTCDVVVADPNRLVGRLVYAPSRGLDIVSVFDVDRFVRIDDIPVGRQPVRVASAARLRRLFVANSLSNNVTVIDTNSRSAVGTIAVESHPTDIALDRRQKEVFVTHRTSPNLVVIDAETLVVRASIYIGPGATAVLADRRRDRIYVAKQNPPEVIVVDRRLAAIVRRIPVRGEILAFAQPLDGPLVYGACPQAGGIVVVNAARGEEERFLPCGQSPTDVVIIN